MTDQLRKAAKMALEALEDSMYPQKKQFDAIIELRQALAQPEQEPDCKMGKMCIGCTPQPEECKPAPQSAQPVGWVDVMFDNDGYTYTLMGAHNLSAGKHDLYTAPPSREWQSVTDAMPKSGVTVLVCYRNSLGNIRRIRAKWTAAKTEETTAEFDWGEYDEETDTYWIPEGWYECIDNWDEFSSIAVGEGEITHWMPLPLAPDDPNYTAPPSSEWVSLTEAESDKAIDASGWPKNLLNDFVWGKLREVVKAADAALRKKNSGEQA